MDDTRSPDEPFDKDGPHPRAGRVQGPGAPSLRALATLVREQPDAGDPGGTPSQPKPHPAWPKTPGAGDAGSLASLARTLAAGQEGEEDPVLEERIKAGWALRDGAVAHEPLDAASVDQFVRSVQDHIVEESGDLVIVPSGDPEVVRSQREVVERTARLLAPDLAGTHALSQAQVDELVSAAVNDICGAGPIESLLLDPEVMEVIARWTEPVLVERHGRLQETDVAFRSDEQIRLVAQRLVGISGRSVDESSAKVSASLPDGSRVNVILPPLCPSGPVVTIRKFPIVHWDLSQMVSFGSLSEEVADLLRAMVRGKVNTLLVGGTSTGKTSFLRAIAMEIPQDEYIVTIEDTDELALGQHLRWVTPLVTKETGSAQVEDVSIRGLLENALRMRPDRIVVGEVRGSEAIDLLDALSSGHDGGLSTLHAQTIAYAITERLPKLCSRTGEVPFLEARRDVLDAIHAVVFLRRRGKRRRVESVAFVDPTPDSSAAIPVVSEVARWIPESSSGPERWEVTETLPESRALARMRDQGVLR